MIGLMILLHSVDSSCENLTQGTDGQLKDMHTMVYSKVQVRVQFRNSIFQGSRITQHLNVTRRSGEEGMPATGPGSEQSSGKGRSLCPRRSALIEIDGDHKPPVGTSTNFSCPVDAVQISQEQRVIQEAPISSKCLASSSCI